MVVATATIALQRQLIDRDLPRLTPALAPLLGRDPTFAILKGRRNYLCLHRLRTGPPEEPGETLFDPAAVSAVGLQVQRLTEWAADTATGDRDDLVPGVEDRAWRQVSVSARECLGAQRCPFGSACFAERAREEAGRVDIVVTNHALLAIDALEEFEVLPEHDVVIIDEAHDLVNRVTSAAAAELSAPAVETAARRCGRVLAAEAAARSGRRGRRPSGSWRTSRPAGSTTCPRRWPPRSPRSATRPARAPRRCAPAAGTAAQDAERLAGWRTALAALDEVGATAGRMLAAFGPDVATGPTWCGWTAQPTATPGGRPRCGSPRWMSARCWPTACSAARRSC